MIQIPERFQGIVPYTKFYESVSQINECDIAKLLRPTAASRWCLIVTSNSGFSSKTNGSFDDVISLLGKYKINYEVFASITPNPNEETIYECQQKYKESDIKFDFIIGIGGGSVVDASKAISFALAGLDFNLSNKVTTVEAYELQILKRHMPIPLIAIVTAVGTGTEATPYAILTKNEQRTKKGIASHVFPVISVVDTKYQKTLPQKLRNSMAIDICCHAIESALSSTSNENTLEAAVIALRHIALYLQTGELQNISEGSLFGGIAISNSGTSIPHGCSYKITYELNVPHGYACGLCLIPYLKLCISQDLGVTDGRIAVLLTVLMGKTRGSINTPEDLLALVNEFESSILSKLLSTLEKPKLTYEQAKAFAADTINSGKTSAHPRPVTQEQIENIYKDLIAKIE